MEQPLSAEPPVAAITDRRQIEILLGLYPDCTPDQTNAIRAFLQKAPIVERSLLDQNEALREKLALFRVDHGAESAISPRDWAVLAALVAVIALSVALLWNSGT